MIKYKLGIIGYGTMGSWHAENVAKRIDGLDVAMIYDIDEKKRKKAAQDGFRICDSAEQLFDSDVDIVLIATPNNFHKEYAVSALEHGKNTISEKPVCMNLQELDEILKAAKRNNKLFTVHFNRRWDDDYDVVKNILTKKCIGKPFQVYSRLFSNRNIPGDWRTRKESGGGFLYDWGIHMIDQILMLFGTPESVYADLKKIYQPDVDDSIRLNLNYPDNLSVHIVADSWTFINEARWHISGNDGTAIIDEWFNTKGRIVRANVKKVDWAQGCVYTKNGLSRTMWPRPQKEISEMPLPVSEESPRWEDFYENIINALDGRERQLITHQQIYDSLAVVMACFESAENKSVVLMNKYEKEVE